MKGVFRPGGLLVLSVLCLLSAPQTARAQTAGAGTGTIDGTLSDTTGAILPGATITATGDALMAPRTVVTDRDGSYRFLALPPGRYTLSFEFPGFDRRAREGVPVRLGVTTTIHAVLEPGAQREVVTVTGGAGLVDRRETAIATAFDAGELRRLPGSRTIGALLAATPAVQLTRIDVGGSTAFGVGPFSVYGTGGYNRPTIEGISVSNMNPFAFAPDYGTFASVSVGTGAYGPEWPSPGLHVRVVTKSGGNRYAGTLYAAYQRGTWQAHNIDDDQIARGAPVADGLGPRESNRLLRYHDLDGDAGGYIRRDRLWWYASMRAHGSASRRVLFPTVPLETWVAAVTGKTTWRLRDDHRVIAFAQASRNREPIRLDGFLRGGAAVHLGVESTSAQRATGLVWKTEWNAIVGRRLLLEARAGQFAASRAERPNGHSPRTEDLRRPEVSGGNRDWRTDWRNTQFNGSLTAFQTGWGGHHELRAGVQLARTMAAEHWLHAYPGDVLHVTENGIPREVYLFQTPSRADSGQWWYAAHLADTWQVRDRVTLNLGLRLDRFRTFLPAQHHPAGRFNPAPMSFAAVPDVASWTVAAPRLAGSVDLRGDGRTILKASYGLHWLPPTTDFGFNLNPNGRVWWERFKWADASGDRRWQAGEEFALLDTRGGEPLASIDPGLKLAYVQEITGRVEREIGAGLLVSTGLVWRGERQQGARQRASWPIEAFSVPVTLRDPGPDAAPGTTDDGGDLQLVELRPELLGEARIVVLNPPYADSDYLTWETSAMRRFSRRWSLFASFAHAWNRDHARVYAGQVVRANEYPATPNDLIHTDARGRHAYRDWSFRAHGTCAGPFGLMITPFVRHQSGQAFGRTLLARLNYAPIRVLAEPVGARRQDHVTLVDVRIEKVVRLGGERLTAFVDVYNALNANPEQLVDWETGPAFLRPLAIVPPRIVRVGVTLDW